MLSFRVVLKIHNPVTSCLQSKFEFLSIVIRVDPFRSQSNHLTVLYVSNSIIILIVSKKLTFHVILKIKLPMKLYQETKLKFSLLSSGRTILEAKTIFPISVIGHNLLSPLLSAKTDISGDIENTQSSDLMSTNQV